MANFIQELLAKIRKADPPPSTLSIPSSKEINTFFNTQSFGNVLTWKQAVRACTALYQTDSRVGSVVDTLSRDTVKGGFRLTSKNSKAEDLANELVDRLNIQESLEQWLKTAFNFGNLFFALGVDKTTSSISEIQRLPSLEIERLTDRIDRFTNRKQAYKWDLKSPIYFQDWEMIHARWNPFDFDKYGRPLLASGLSLWTKVTDGESDISIARATRAGVVRTHVLEDGTPEDLDEYKEVNKAALAKNVPITNLFSNRKTQFTQHEGASNLPDIKDVNHFIESWFAGSPVPMALIAYGADLTRDVINLKEKQYRRAIEQNTDWIDFNIIMPMVKVEWLLNGILPEDVDYETAWKSKDPLTAADLRDIADSVLRFKAVGVNDELIATFISRFIPGIDVNSLVQQLAANTQDGQNTNNQGGQNTNGISNDGSGNNFDSSRVGSTQKKFGVALNRK